MYGSEKVNGISFDLTSMYKVSVAQELSGRLS